MRRIYHKPVPFTQRTRNPWRGLVSPDGICYPRIPDLHAFCIAHQLDHNQIYKLAKGEISEVEGWTKMRWTAIVYKV